jgi:hypothetical protein
MAGQYKRTGFGEVVLKAVVILVVVAVVVFGLFVGICGLGLMSR